MKALRRMLGAGTLVLTLALSLPADARVGGGQNYGGGSSSSSYSGGSSSSSNSDLVGLLLWLCIQHPVIGIPLTLGVVGFTLYSKARGGPSSTGGLRKVGTSKAIKRPARPNERATSANLSDMASITSIIY